MRIESTRPKGVSRFSGSFCRVTSQIDESRPDLFMPCRLVSAMTIFLQWFSGYETSTQVSRADRVCLRTFQGNRVTCSRATGGIGSLVCVPAIPGEGREP